MREEINQRQIKSFVLRQGKITLGQKKAMDELFPVYGLNYQASLLDLNQVFGRDNPKVIEIGFGMGHATWQIAKANQEVDYLGIEVHEPGVGALLMQVQAHNLTNLRVIRHDAVAVLNAMIPAQSINGFHIFFPDPWHKKRHHKRRIIQPQFVELLCSKLMPGGYLHLATDWENYAEHMLEVLQANPQLVNQSATATYIPRPDSRPLTKFEQRGLNLGHGVWDLRFVKI